MMKARKVWERNARQRMRRFAAAWNECATVEEVCRRYSNQRLTPASARKRAWRARRAGFDLKHHTPNRRDVVRSELGDRGRPVSAICRSSGLSDTAVRSHLLAMESEGLVTRTEGAGTLGARWRLA